MTTAGPEDLVDLAERVAGWARRARTSRSTWHGGARPRSAPTRAKSSRSPRPSPPASASGSWWTTGSASPGRGRSTRRSWQRRWPRRGTTPHSPPPTSTCSWPYPTGSPRCRSTCGTSRLAGDADRRRRWSWRWPSRPGPRAADPRIRQVDSADYGDVASEAALVSTTGIRPSSRKTSGYLSVGVIAGDGDASQTGGGFSVGPGFDGLDPEQAPSDAVDAGGPPARRHQGARPAARRWSSTGGWPPPCCRSSPRRCPARPWPRAGRSSPDGWASRSGTRASPWWTIRPTRGRSAPPPTTPRGWPAGATS